MKHGPNPALISRRNAGIILEVCTKTLYRWERAGKLTGIKLNARTTRYYRHELEKLIADSAVAPGGAQ
jgi:YD repeat-containing protein